MTHSISFTLQLLFCSETTIFSDDHCQTVENCHPFCWRLHLLHRGKQQVWWHCDTIWQNSSPSDSSGTKEDSNRGDVSEKVSFLVLTAKVFYLYSWFNVRCFYIHKMKRCVSFSQHQAQLEVWACIWTFVSIQILPCVELLSFFDSWSFMIIDHFIRFYPYTAHFTISVYK